MSGGYIESKGAIITFLFDLKRILKDIDSNLEIFYRYDKDYLYTTKFCMQSLKYNFNDVKKELLNLRLCDYVETCDDKRNKKTNKYYIFTKKIQNKDIYIKIKIKSYSKKEVVCMSFHFAEYNLKKVYKNS